MADYNSKYSGEQVESLLDMVANGETGGGGGGGLPYYIVQSFDVVTITNGYSGEVEVDSQEMAHLFRAIHEGKVVLIPYELGEDLGYYIASGYAEDLIYLSLVVSGNIIDIEISVNNATATLSYTQKRNVEYENGEIGSPNIARAEGFYSPTTDLKYALPYTDAAEDINPDYVLGVASRISILDSTSSEAFTLKPFNESILTPAGTSYSFDFEGVPTAENLATEGYVLPEWKLIIKELQSSISLSFPDSVEWANSVTPNFTDCDVVEFSFIPIVYGGQQVYLLGTWTSYVV